MSAFVGDPMQVLDPGPSHFLHLEFGSCIGLLAVWGDQLADQPTRPLGHGRGSIDRAVAKRGLARFHTTPLLPKRTGCHVAGPRFATGNGPVGINDSGSERVAKFDKERVCSMSARPRQTAHICAVVELTEDAAVRAHRLLLLSWQDGQICEREAREILAATSETVAYAGSSVTAAAEADHSIAAGLALIHNGNSPRARRLLGELNIVEVDFRGSDPDDPTDSGAPNLRAA